MQQEARPKPELSAETRALVQATTEVVAHLIAGYRVAPQLREELLSAGYEALTLAASRYDPEQGPFEPFARLQVRTAVFRAVRKEARAQSLLPAEAEPERDPEPPPDLEPAHLSAASLHAASGALRRKSELQRELEAALQTLPEEERTAFLAYAVQGHTQEEIAQKAGVSKRTVQRRIERAVQVVRERMEE